MRILYYCLAALADEPLADSIVGDLEELRRTGRRVLRTALGILLHVAVQKLREAFAMLRVSDALLKSHGLPVCVA